jgi:hypothetical protein
MTLTMADPGGLKPQEYECGSVCTKLLILYIPMKDKLEEMVETTATTFKLILPHNVELRGSI